MNIQEINSEFSKAAKQIIHLVDNSQKKALINYMSKVAKDNNLKDMASSMQFVWDKYQDWQSRQPKMQDTLALYLNTQMTNNLK